MAAGAQEIMVCNCERTMSIDGDRLGAALGCDPLKVHSHLCRTEIARYEAALGQDRPLLVACTQEAPLFREIAEETGRGDTVSFVNIRERAGWSEAGASAGAKIAALLAEACVNVTPAGMTTLKSEGTCLVYGAGQAALDAAIRLASRLSVTLLLSDAGDAMPPESVDVPIFTGRISAATGRFGAFEITVDGYAPMVASSRRELEFLMPRDGARSTCDLILDLTGNAPLFASPRHREGYFSVDPRHPSAVSDALFEISELVGEFEKPLYVTYRNDLCAHGRSGQTGCTRCLDVCPASAIDDQGDLISVDPGICGGCGSCSSVCPTGAVSYTYPSREDVIERARTLLSTFRAAGGTDTEVLVHDNRHGLQLMSASARFGRGLPANVLPFALNEVTSLGHEAMASMIAAGARRITVLASPAQAEELAGLEAEAELLNRLLEAMGHGDAPRARILVEADPERLEEVLWGREIPGEIRTPAFALSGGKRTIARAAFTLLNETAPAPQQQIPLPEGAPYGRISIDTEGCTLCLACVSACPADALHDNPDRPQVRFIEQACVQCGLCRNTCPENVIRLEPRLDLTPQALDATILNEEDPFECIRCGKPFGTKSTVEHILARLGGTHSMYRNADTIELIKMCDDCRITAQAEGGNDPMAMGSRPRVRTTEDYLALEEAAKSGKSSVGELRIEDFLAEDD